MWKYANPQLRNLQPYEPGKPVEDLARELGLEPGKIIKLASNENPLGPSPKARQAMIETLERLRAIGVRTALDDFGTGYSSLSYLEILPLDKVKIDRSFATSIDTSQRSGSMMRGITGIARDLDLEVIVEGIETEEQLAALGAYGIDGVQGYVFARPMDVISLLPLLVHKMKPNGMLANINQARRKRTSAG